LIFKTQMKKINQKLILNKISIKMTLSLTSILAKIFGLPDLIAIRINNQIRISMI